MTDWVDEHPHVLKKARAQDDGLKAPSPPYNGTPPRRGIVKLIPPLRGDSGGCAFFSFFVRFLSIPLFSG